MRRFDGGNWDLPGGRIEVGETAGQAVIREVAKESGVRIALAGLSGDRYYWLAQPRRPGFASEFISADQSIQRDSKLLDEQLHSRGPSSLANALTTRA